MLSRSSILHVLVAPEDSLQRNRERATPGPAEDQSVAHHRVPDTVMRHDYDTDDLPYLIAQGKGRAIIETTKGLARLPATSFDNRSDFTSPLRGDPDGWPAVEMAAIHGRLKVALSGLTPFRS
jgi:hypothetical protein